MGEELESFKLSDYEVFEIIKKWNHHNKLTFKLN